MQIPEAGTAGGAVLAAVLTAFIQTGGRRQWMRMLAAAGTACLIAATGITIPEIALGRALADPDRSSTYLPARIVPESTENPATTTSATPRVPNIKVEPNSVDCIRTAPGTVVECTPITVTSTGPVPLRITTIDPPAGDEFSIDDSKCEGQELAKSETCLIRTWFHPPLRSPNPPTSTTAGPPTATIVIHQNIPPPDTGTPVKLTGSISSDPP